MKKKQKILEGEKTRASCCYICAAFLALRQVFPPNPLGDTVKEDEFLLENSLSVSILLAHEIQSDFLG